MAPQLEETDTEDEIDSLNGCQSPEDAKARAIQLRGRALEFWHKDQWESIMNMYTNDDFFDTLLCWIRPTRDFLSFLHAELRRLHVSRIVSVGCGCGFLEWLIRRACSGITVVGYELDRAWWQGRFGVKPFIEHVYIDEVKTRHIPEDSVLMTCYFHSWEGWRQYLAEFRGDIVIVIGPHTNKHVTFPEPRHVLADDRFILEGQREIAGGDMVVVMRRNRRLWPVPPPPAEPADGLQPLPSVKPPESKAQRSKQFNEMRRSFVLDRICSAKKNPKTVAHDPQVRQGPALRSNYRTLKPSLAFSLGMCSVAARAQSMGGCSLKRSVSASARLESVGLEVRPLQSRRRPERLESGATSAAAGHQLTMAGPLRESRSVPSLAPLEERSQPDNVWPQPDPPAERKLRQPSTPHSHEPESRQHRQSNTPHSHKPKSRQQRSQVSGNKEGQRERIRASRTRAEQNADDHSDRDPRTPQQAMSDHKKAAQQRVNDTRSSAPATVPVVTVTDLSTQHLRRGSQIGSVLLHRRTSLRKAL